MISKPLKVAWISYFPVEWMADAPVAVRQLPRRHPASWLQSGVEEFKKRDDVELHVLEVSKDLPHDVTFRSGNVTFHCLKIRGGLRAPTLFWSETMMIKRVLRQIKPEVVHAWGTEKGAALVASRLPYPNLISLQGLMTYFANTLPVTRYERFVAWCERISLRRARYASGESTFVTDYLRKHYPHLQVFHIEHAPTKEFFEISRRPETSPKQLLTVGTISFRKGTDLLMQALDRLKNELDFHLTLVGFWSDKRFFEEIKARTSAQLWDRVSVLETIPTAEVLQRLAQTTMVILPTRADTGPVAVKEAAVAGAPVLGSVMGGIPDYIIHGKNGLLFPPDNLKALTTAIREGCSHPLFARGNVDPNANADVRAQLAPSKMAEGFLLVYKELAGRLATIK